MRFGGSHPPFLAAICGRFSSSGRNLGVRRSKEPASQDQIGEAEQREQLGVVLRQTTVARFAMLEQALHDMDAILDFRSNAGFGLLQLFLRAPQRILLERLAHARAHREVLIDFLVHVF